MLGAFAVAALPASRQYPRLKDFGANLLGEAVGTFVLLLVPRDILEEGRNRRRRRWPGALSGGALVLAIGLSRVGPTVP